MTRHASDSRLNRVWTSWFTLLAVVLCLAAVGVGLGWKVHQRATTQAEAGAVGAGYLIAATTVAPGISPKTGAIDTKAIDASVAGLIENGGVLGLTVWLADGTVVYAGTMTGYGNVVVIDHSGDLSTLYGHLSSYVVAKGESVARGEQVA